jgi:hypothetical protein
VQGILTGIGFLGAGVILRDPKGHVSGLTTAATIWICAVLGIVCGLGYWWILAIALGPDRTCAGIWKSDRASGRAFVQGGATQIHRQLYLDTLSTADYPFLYFRAPGRTPPQPDATMQHTLSTVTGSVSLCAPMKRTRDPAGAPRPGH